MGRPNLTDAERIARLPEWAQGRIRTQEARLAALETENRLLHERVDGMLAAEAAGPDPVDTYLAKDNPPGVLDAPDFPLGHGPVIRFGDWAEVHWANGCLTIDTDSAMIIVPEHDGSVYVTKADQ